MQCIYIYVCVLYIKHVYTYIIIKITHFDSSNLNVIELQNRIIFSDIRR